MPVSFRPQLYFAYDDIADDKRSIRLVTLLSGEPQPPIRCRLSKHNLDSDKTQFCALSYTWGRSLEYRWITVNGIRFFVRPNLYHALSALRKTDEDVVLWIDAICIDQTNPSERTHQVGMMSAIYSSASFVILWLGPAIAEYEPALEDMTAGEATGDLRNDLQLRQSYLAIGKNPYWRRAWIRQELLLAKRISVRCGTSELSWDVLQKSYRSALHFVQTWDVDTTYPESFLSTFHREVNTDAARRGIATLEELILKYGSSECQDVRDQVYALLSLATDCQGDDPLVADYEIEPTVLFFTVLDFCKSEQPVRFSQHLGNTLMMCVGKINRVIEDPEFLRKEFQKDTPLTARGANHLKTIRQEIQYFKTHGYRGSSDYWTEICLVCCQDSVDLNIPRLSKRLFWIYYPDIGFIMRPALAGYILHRLLTGLGESDMPAVLDPTQDPGWEDKIARDLDWSKDLDKASESLKRSNPRSLTHRSEGRLGPTKVPTGIEEVGTMLYAASSGKVGFREKYGLDLRACQALLKDLYDIRLEEFLIPREFLTPEQLSFAKEFPFLGSCSIPPELWIPEELLN